jgi:hypothetical protein
MIIDFKKVLIPERQRLLNKIGIAMTDTKIKLDRPWDTYSTGEQALILFIKSPQTPLDVSKISREYALDAVDIFVKFWKEYL